MIFNNRPDDLNETSVFKKKKKYTARIQQLAHLVKNGKFTRYSKKSPIFDNIAMKI